MDKMITSILDSGICMNGNTLVLPGVCIIELGSNSDSALLYKVPSKSTGKNYVTNVYCFYLFLTVIGL